MNTNSENKEENKKITDQEITSEQTEQSIPTPIPVQIVSDPSGQMKSETVELFGLLKRRLTEVLDLIPKPPGKLMRFWLWFQKHGMTTVCFIALGIVIGVGIEKHLNNVEMVKAINMQKMEFQHNGKRDKFTIIPDTTPNFYNDDQPPQIQQPPPVNKVEVIPPEPVKPVKKGRQIGTN
jgi:hypothetical protein